MPHSPRPLLTICTAAAAIAAPAYAQEQPIATAPADSIQVLRDQIKAQRTALDRQQAELDRLTALADMLMAGQSGGQAPPRNLVLADAAQPAAPVGVAPPAESIEDKVEVASLPEGSGVLTPRGHGALETSVDYTHGSTNRLVFRGVEIVTGVQIGVIEASDADRNATSAAITSRFGVTDRLEVEARIPYIYRSDRITTLVQREESATRTMNLRGQGLGDVEFAARYQVNNGGGGWPVAIAALRLKSDVGGSPFNVSRDEFGVAEALAVGSGFWAVEPSVSFLYPTDPAVIFASFGWLHNIPKDIDKSIGGVLVGRVEPGDSISAGAGFGFALNPRFSFSLGYKHAYIRPTKTELGPTIQKSESLQVGAFTFGWSFRLNDRLTLSNTYEIGTTRDAPDMRVAFRLPIRF